MKKTQNVIARAGLAVTACASVFVASNADAGVSFATSALWNRFSQEDVLATYTAPAFSIPRAEYLPGEDPTPNDGDISVEHPIVIYYTFLTEEMLEVSFEEGEDDFNVLGMATDDNVDTLIDDPNDTGTASISDNLIGQPFLPTGGTISLDPNDSTAEVVPACFTIALDGVPNDGSPGGNAAEITGCDDPADVDGIAEFWPARDGIAPVLDVIPPPVLPDDLVDIEPPMDPAMPDEDAITLAVYRYYGLGNARWGNDRPYFTHPDGEAIWTYAQYNFGPNGGRNPGQIEFRETMPYDPIDPDGEEAAQIRLALREIEKIANIRFYERDVTDAPAAATQGPFAPPATVSGGVIQIPDGAGGTISVFETDQDREPADDYPFILFTGDPTFAGGPDVGGLAFGAGSARGPINFSHFDVDYVLDDLNGDGFPDLLDSPSVPGNEGAPANADNAPDIVLLSQDDTNPSTPPAPTPGDSTTALFTSPATPVFNGPGGPVGWIQVQAGPLTSDPNSFLDFNFDGVPDTLLAIEGEIYDGAGNQIAQADIGPAGNVQAVVAGGPVLAVPNAIDVDGDGLPDDIDGDGFLDVPFVSGPTIGSGILGLSTSNTFGLTVRDSDPLAIGLAEPTAVSQIQISFANVDVGGIRGVTIHEMFHQLGFLHEQVRPDRDQFIDVDFSNIAPNIADQYLISPGAITYGIFDGQTFNGEPNYDFESIMHYGSCSAIPGDACLSDNRAMNVLPPFTQQFQPVIGTVDLPSAGDIASIQELYNKPQLLTDNPCLADISGDFRLTFEDIIAFLNVFYLPCASDQPIDQTLPPTNICRQTDEVYGNFDGFVDTLDLIRYFSLFRATRGCSPRTVVPVGPTTPIAGNNISPV